MMSFIRYFKFEEHDEENAKSYAAVSAATVTDFGTLDFPPTSNDNRSSFPQFWHFSITSVSQWLANKPGYE